METTKTETLVERWNNAETKTTEYHNGETHTWYPVRNQMMWELGHLLGLEIEWGNALCGNEEKLKEYKANFEWDTDYSVNVKWEIEPASYTQGIDCSSAEEVKEYLKGEKELEEPEWDEDVDMSIDYGAGFTGDFRTKPVISVSNMRLKKAKFQYAVQLVVDCEEALPELEVLIKSTVEAHNAFTKAEVVSFTANT